MQFTSILVDWMYIQKAIEIGQPTIKTGEPACLKLNYDPRETKKIEELSNDLSAPETEKP